MKMREAQRQAMKPDAQRSTHDAGHSMLLQRSFHKTIGSPRDTKKSISLALQREIKRIHNEFCHLTAVDRISRAE